jgi:hypothetical protein
MKSFLILVLLGISPVLTWCQERIEWSASQKITVSDFKGKAPEASSKQTLIARTGIESKLTGAEVKKMKNFNQQITNYFFPGDSWIHASDKSRLPYFHVLFDMNEWMARELRKKCRENRKMVLANQYDLMYAQVTAEFAKIREQYDQETDYGDNKQKQLEWEKKIHDRLTDLSDFCKQCGKKN